MMGEGLLLYKRAHFVDVFFVAVYEAAFEIHRVAFYFLSLFLRLSELGTQLLYSQLLIGKIRM